MKQVIIFQQGSGSRILSAYLWGEVAPEPFAEKPIKSKETSKEILRSLNRLRISYRHLESHPFLYDMLDDWQIIHLYRDPGRTFTREIAKYNLTVTKNDLKNYIDKVRDSRKKVNKLSNVVITHYEDFIKELYDGDLREFNHL